MQRRDAGRRMAGRMISEGRADRVKYRNVLLVVAVLYLLALAVRLVPVSFSPLPYNVDSLAESRMSQDIVNSGGLVYPHNASYLEEKHGTITPLYNVFLAMCSVIMGIPPAQISPLIIPIITSVSVVAIYLIVMRMTGNKFAAIGAGMFLALSGTYVSVTLAPWKEAIGFAILPMILYLYVNREEDVRIRALSIFLLLLLPLLHHLVTAVAYLIVTFATVIPLARNFLQKKFAEGDKIDLLALGSVWVFAGTYYYLNSFNRVEFFSLDSGLWLFVSVLAIMLLIGLYASRRTPTRLHMVFLIPSILMALFVINYFVPIFPLTTSTNKTLLTYIIPYILLIYPLLIGFALVLDSGSKYRVFLVSLFIGPLAIIVFGFLWGLNPATSYPMIIRTYDFFDIGIAVAIGVGFAWMANRLRNRNAKAAFCALFVLTVLVTTPLAYNTQKAFEIQNTTYDYELNAIVWIKDMNHANLNISSDRRLWEIGHRVYDLNGDFTLPIRIKTTSNLPGNKICILESQWSRSPGAQMYPLDSVVVPKSMMENRIIPDNNLLGCTGPSDNMVFIMVKP